MLLSNTNNNLLVKYRSILGDHLSIYSNRIYLTIYNTYFWDGELLIYSIDFARLDKNTNIVRYYELNNFKSYPICKCNEISGWPHICGYCRNIILESSLVFKSDDEKHRLHISYDFSVSKEPVITDLYFNKYKNDTYIRSNYIIYQIKTYSLNNIFQSHEYKVYPDKKRDMYNQLNISKYIFPKYHAISEIDIIGDIKNRIMCEFLMVSGIDLFHF
jgi:hypothetical protein